jgi:cytoskeletal protein RodZ
MSTITWKIAGAACALALVFAPVAVLAQSATQQGEQQGQSDMEDYTQTQTQQSTQGSGSQSTSTSSSSSSSQSSGDNSVQQQYNEATQVGDALGTQTKALNSSKSKSCTGSGC